MKKVLISLSALLIIGMCLLPPHEATRIKTNAGMPSATETTVTTYRVFWKQSTWSDGDYRYEGEIDTAQLGIQIIIVLGVGAVGGVLANE